MSNDAYSMKRAKNANQPPSHIVILNIIRHPLDTIISAYNYHVTGPEGWTRVPLHEITTLEQKYQEEKESACTADLFMNLTRELGHSTNVSVETLYRDVLSTSQGIYFEYLRYSHCCFPEIYSSYSRIIDLQNRNHDVFNDYDYNLMHFDNLRSEGFGFEFNKSCYHLMDKLGIIEEKDRKSLMEQLLEFDLSTYSKESLRKKMHITKGKFNKEEQVRILLTPLNRHSEL
eukprot:918146_1